MWTLASVLAPLDSLYCFIGLLSEELAARILPASVDKAGVAGNAGEPSLLASFLTRA